MDAHTRQKQYQAILINSIGDKDRFKRLVENNTFKNYAGDPVGKVVKLRATLDVLETFLSVVKQDGEEFTAEEKKGLRELLTHYKSELEKVRDRKSIIETIIKNIKTITEIITKNVKNAKRGIKWIKQKRNSMKRWKMCCCSWFWMIMTANVTDVPNLKD